MNFLKRNYKLWVPFVVVILLPAFLPQMIEPEWLGRIIANAGFLYVLPIILIWAFFDPTIRFLAEESLAYKHWGQKAEMFLWGVAFLFMITIVIGGTIPFTKDIIEIKKDGRPVFTFQGTIRRASQTTTTGFGFLYQSVSLIGTSTDYYLFYHEPLAHHRGYVFEFTALPYSKIILEIQSISTSHK